MNYSQLSVIMLSQKRESNADSLHSHIYQLIKRMINDENSTQLESAKIWDNVINDLNGEVIKAQTIQTADFGPVSQKQIIQILKMCLKQNLQKDMVMLEVGYLIL